MCYVCLYTQVTFRGVHNAVKNFFLNPQLVNQKVWLPKRFVAKSSGLSNQRLQILQSRTAPRVSSSLVSLRVHDLQNLNYKWLISRKRSDLLELSGLRLNRQIARHGGWCQISSEIMGVLRDILIYQPTVPQPCRHLMIPVVGMKPVVLAQWSADLPFPLQVSGSTPHGIARCTRKVMSQVLSLHELNSPRQWGCVRYPPRSWGC